MLPQALTVAPLIMAVVLIASAVGKLRAPESAREAFNALDVPRSLQQDWLIKVHPWAEIALAVAIVGAPGRLGLVAAGLGVILMLTYLWLVILALRKPVSVDCACFGALGEGRITMLTVWRNVWLTAVAAVTLLLATEERPAISRLAHGGDVLWLVIAAAAAALTVGFVVTRVKVSEPGVGMFIEQVDEDDYVRARTPAVPVTLANGAVRTLRDLSAARAQLLLFVSESCGSCQSVISAVPEWRRAMPQIDFRLVVRLPPASSALTSAEEPMTVHDVEGWAADSLGTRITPSAVLLGADGSLAGGPAVGSIGVPTFIAQVQIELSDGQYSEQ